MSAEVAQVLYDRRAGVYDGVMNVIRHEATRTNLLRSLPLPHELPAGAQILNIGCGTGLVAECLLEKYPGVTITGLDVTQKTLAIHYERYPTVPLVIGDFNTGEGLRTYRARQPVTLAPGSFHLIVSAGALSEYGTPQTA